MLKKIAFLFSVLLAILCVSCDSQKCDDESNIREEMTVIETSGTELTYDGNIDYVSPYDGLPEVTVSEISFDDISYRTLEEYMAQDETDDTPYKCSWEMTEDVSDVPEENIILWAVPSMGEKYEGYSEGEKAVNEQLRKDGYPFRMKIVTIPDDENYSIKAANSDADIIYTGDRYGEPYAPSYRFVHEEKGKYIQLDEYLEGSTLWEHCPQIDWDSVEYKGAHYVVPNYALCGELGMQVRIKKSAYTEEELEGFDGTLDTLLPLVSKERKLYSNMGDFDWLTLEGISYAGYGIYYDENGDIGNVMDLDINIRWMRELNRLFREGIAFEDFSPEICEDEWSIAVTAIPDKNRFNEYEYYIYNFAGQSNIFYSSALAIRSTSNNPKMAFKLMELIITDRTYANLMAYAGTGLIEKDGFMYDPVTAERAGAGIRRYYFGLQDNMGRSDYVIASFDTPEERADYVTKYIKKTDDKLYDYPALLYLLSSVKKDYSRIIQETNREAAFNKNLAEYIARSRQAFKILEEYQ